VIGSVVSDREKTTAGQVRRPDLLVRAVRAYECDVAAVGRDGRLRTVVDDGRHHPGREVNDDDSGRSGRVSAAVVALALRDDVQSETAIGPGVVHAIVGGDSAVAGFLGGQAEADAPESSRSGLLGVEERSTVSGPRWVVSRATVGGIDEGDG